MKTETCQHERKQKAKDAYGKMATWCSNCGSRLSPLVERAAPGTIGHRIALQEIMFGNSKVKEWPTTCDMHQPLEFTPEELQRMDDDRGEREVYRIEDACDDNSNPPEVQ